MGRFIVLRDLARNWRRVDIPLGNAFEPLDPDAPCEPEILSLELSAQELRDIPRDPCFLTMAAAMPTKLVNPEPLDGLRPDEVEPGWAMRVIGADRTDSTGTGARVALLDTGIDPKHPAFDGVNPTMRDFAGTGAEDANGHGTHLAGTILGRDIGGIRIGVARGTQDLLVGKVVADNGVGQSGDFLKGALWAMREGADVIAFALVFDTAAAIEARVQEGYPMSLACSAAVHAHRGNLRIFEHVLAMMGDRAPLMLGAVGNDSMRIVSPDFQTAPASPAAAKGVLAIGACGPSENGLVPADFSNLGPALSAPGVGIVSADLSRGLRPLNGTSMAVAHTAGIAALWAEKMRGDGENVTARALATKLLGHATAINTDGGSDLFDFGKGVVSAPVRF